VGFLVSLVLVLPVFGLIFVACLLGGISLWFGSMFTVSLWWFLLGVLFNVLLCVLGPFSGVCAFVAVIASPAWCSSVPSAVGVGNGKRGPPAGFGFYLPLKLVPLNLVVSQVPLLLLGGVPLCSHLFGWGVFCLLLMLWMGVDHLVAGSVCWVASFLSVHLLCARA